MKEIKGSGLNIIKSRYVVITIAAVICITAALGVGPELMAFKSSGKWGVPDEEKVQELLAGGGEIVFPFGKYSDIIIADSEKGIFGVTEAAETGDEYKYVDAEGNPVDYHKPDDQEQFKISDDGAAVMDTSTGKEVFRTAPGERIEARFGSCWIIDGTNSEEFEGEDDGIMPVYFYALDENFKVTLDGMLFNYYKNYGRYMLLQEVKDATYYTRGKIYGKSLFDGNTANTVIDTEGNVIYRDNDYSDDGYIRGIVENIMIKGNGKVLTYFDLDKMKAGDADPVIRRNEKLMCTMDFEDGSAAANRLKHKAGSDNRTLEDFEPAGSKAERNMAKYKWGYVDENFEPVTSMNFDGAYASENGYGVVIYKGCKALIKLKGGVAE